MSKITAATLRNVAKQNPHGDVLAACEKAAREGKFSYEVMWGLDLEDAEPFFLERGFHIKPGWRYPKGDPHGYRTTILSWGEADE